MIKTIKPFGAIVEFLIAYRFAKEGKYYIVDELSNVMEVSEEEYKKLKCPIRKFRQREVNEDGEND